MKIRNVLLLATAVLTFSVSGFAQKAKKPLIAMPEERFELSISGYLPRINAVAEYRIVAIAGAYIRAEIENAEGDGSEGPIMIGEIQTPNAKKDGQPAGVFQEGIVKMGGTYVLRVKQNAAKSRVKNVRFTLKIRYCAIGSLCEKQD